MFFSDYFGVVKCYQFLSKFSCTHLGLLSKRYCLCLSGPLRGLMVLSESSLDGLCGRDLYGRAPVCFAECVVGKLVSTCPSRGQDDPRSCVFFPAGIFCATTLHFWGWLTTCWCMSAGTSRPTTDAGSRNSSRDSVANFRHRDYSKNLICIRVAGITTCREQMANSRRRSKGFERKNLIP